MSAPLGLYACIGTTGSGKTYRATSDAVLEAQARGVGCLVLDSCASRLFREEAPFSSIPLARDLRTAIEEVILHKRIVRFVPQDLEEGYALMRVATDPGGFVLVIDEIGVYSARHRDLTRCLRLWRNRDTSVYVTTQVVGNDLGQVFQGCNPEFRLFKCTASASIDFFSKAFKIDVDAMLAQNAGEFLTLRL